MTDRLPSEYDPLDELLDQAAWPETEPLQVARLQREWDQLVLRRRRRQRRFAIAAALACASTAAYFTMGQWDSSTVVENSIPRSTAAPVVAPNSGRDDTPQQSIPVNPIQDDSPQVGPTTVFEQTMVAAIERQLERQHQRRIAERNDRQGALAEHPEIDVPIVEQRLVTVGELVQRAIQEPDGDIQKIVAEWPASHAKLETQLIRFLRRRDVSADQLLAGANLLALVATDRSLPVLNQLQRWTPTHTVATLAVARLVSPVELRRMIQMEPLSETRTDLVAELFQRGDELSIGQMLALTQQIETSDDVMRVARNSLRPPLAGLVLALQAPRVADRVAAAAILSEIPHEQVAHVLVRLVLENVSRREALIALARRSDPQSAEFLRRAEADLMLGASVRAARSRAESLPN